MNPSTAELAALLASIHAEVAKALRSVPQPPQTQPALSAGALNVLFGRVKSVQGQIVERLHFRGGHGIGRRGNLLSDAGWRN